jgi:hypothetical protein
MDSSWIDFLAAISGGLSALTALIAVVIAIRSERRSREVLKAQMYLTLRQGFHDIYRELGDLTGRSEEDTDLRMARQAYWHHAFDEWYISQLAPRELGDMWNAFFKRATLSGWAHPALKATLDELAKDRSSGFGAYAQPFICELMEQPRKR